jgi:hypothetical protein
MPSWLLIAIGGLSCFLLGWLTCWIHERLSERASWSGHGWWDRKDRDVT